LRRFVVAGVVKLKITETLARFATYFNREKYLCLQGFKEKEIFAPEEKLPESVVRFSQAEILFN
jgi:hypothetical protein